MKKNYRYKNFVLLLLCSYCLFTNLSTAYADDCSGREHIGNIQSASNDVKIVDGLTGEIRSVGGVNAVDNLSENAICRGDEVKTGSSSRAFIHLIELNALVRLDANTVLGLTGTDHLDATGQSNKPEENGFLALCREKIQRSWLNLKQGALRLFTTRPQELDITTKYLNASIEGTEFSVLVTHDRTRIDVTQGEVLVCNSQGAEQLDSGESVESIQGNEPVFVGAENAVQWAVYFPAVEEGTELGSISARALEMARSGKGQAALRLLSGSNVSFHLALSAMIYVTIGESARASVLASRSVRIDPYGAINWLALSYTQQSQFKVKEALDSIVKARELAPRRADIRVREIELLQINGFGQNALAKAKLATDEYPDFPRAQVALGFLQLYNYEHFEARRSFETAMLLDKFDPMPRFGLGLSYMRQGDSASAKLEMQIAVNLDPMHSLLRSYLSRVYLELGLIEQASEQLEVAIALDKNDPLPLFFSAILQQQQGNSPAALAALSNSIEKINRRAVYRSAVAQDTDMAVVLSSRARIYDSLGFRRLTLLDGAESVQSDPQSYVAHRLLADTYQNRPRLEFARRSELLQSQMRQPLSNNPGQFRLFDRRSSAFRESGPFASTFNEYTRLFTREGVASQWGILAQSLNTKGVEGQITRLKKNTLGSVSVYFISSDGLDVNRDERLGIISGFFQYRLTSRLDYQLNLEHTNFKSGDDDIRFYRTRYFKDERNRENLSTARVGFNFRQSDTISWLLNIEHGEILDSASPGVPFSVDLRDTTKGQVIDLQNTVAFSDSRLVSGLLLSQQNIVQREIDSASSTRKIINIAEGSVYSYFYKPIVLAGSNKVDALVGVSYDRNTGRDGRRNATIGPKLGLTGQWRGSRIRLAAVRTSKRSLIGSRTLEPSQVMGFPQEFNDDLVDNSTLFGFGVDRSITVNALPRSTKINIGGMLTRRQTEFASNEVVRPRLLESEAELFIYVPLKKSAALLEWTVMKRRTKRSSNSNNPFERSVGLTHRIDLGIKRFWTDKFAASLTAKWRNQDGEFYSYVRGVLEKGKSSTWIFDLAAQWRLPIRRGAFQAAELSIGVDNIFNTKYNFEDIDPFISRESYERSIKFALQSRFN